VSAGDPACSFAFRHFERVTMNLQRARPGNEAAAERYIAGEHVLDDTVRVLDVLANHRQVDGDAGFAENRIHPCEGTENPLVGIRVPDLAGEIGTTEASIYRYFENKHRLLTYIVSWFWAWMEYQVIINTNNEKEPAAKIRKLIQLLTLQVKDEISFLHIDKQQLFRITIAEGTKSYLTKHVNEDNKVRLFKPYKDLCGRIASIFTEYSPAYQFPSSLASTLLEAAHFQYYFKQHLPSLTDFAEEKTNDRIAIFLDQLVFSTLDAAKNKAKGKK
jgi:AcrR family transcriptional regulator